MNELEKFKREINIAEVAQLFGYALDKKSSRATKALKNPETGHKIIVSRNAKNGHYVYFSTDREESGTLIDFLQARTGQNLGHTRKWCRRYLAGGVNTAGIVKVDVKATDADTHKIMRIWERIDGVDENKASFVSWRGIDTWEKVVEKGRVKIDRDGNFYFPMYTVNGLSGVEKISSKTNEKRVISGSKKGLWSFSPDIGMYTEADLIVVTESPLDALSWYKLNRNSDSFADKSILLVATMGAIGEEQKLALRVLARRSNAREWILATDADNAGERIAEEVRKAVKEADRSIKMYRHKPMYGKDWNEELLKVVRKKERNSTPALSQSL